MMPGGRLRSPCVTGGWMGDYLQAQSVECGL
jgi:hypothetical protein